MAIESMSSSDILLILLGGIIMAVASFSGGLLLALPQKVFNACTLPLVSFSAGTLLGGALFHLLPEATEAYHDDDFMMYVNIAVGFTLFLIIERSIHILSHTGGMCVHPSTATALFSKERDCCHHHHEHKTLKEAGSSDEETSESDAESLHEDVVCISDVCVAGEEAARSTPGLQSTDSEEDEQAKIEVKKEDTSVEVEVLSKITPAEDTVTKKSIKSISGTQGKDHHADLKTEFIHNVKYHEKRDDLAWMVLLGDAIHNLAGGLAFGAAFISDRNAGLATWLAEIFHEVPQEIGDFGIFMHSGWSVKFSLLANFLSALAHPLGALLSGWLSSSFDVRFFLPFSAGNFIYLAASGLLPETKHTKILSKNAVNVGSFVGGLAFLAILRTVLGEDHEH